MRKGPGDRVNGPRMGGENQGGVKIGWLEDRKSRRNLCLGERRGVAWVIRDRCRMGSWDIGRVIE